MNEVEFRNWLLNKGVKPKVAGDMISRLKRIEREMQNCDIDEHYQHDRCEHILQLFLTMGNNEEMKKYPNTDLPVGKYYMSTYRYAIKRYIQFLNEGTIDSQ